MNRDGNGYLDRCGGNGKCRVTCGAGRVVVWEQATPAAADSSGSVSAPGQAYGFSPARTWRRAIQWISPDAPRMRRTGKSAVPVGSGVDLSPADQQNGQQ